MNENVQNNTDLSSGSAGTTSDAATASTTKFCKHCGAKIAAQAVICPTCGCQVEEIHNQGQDNPQPIVINNTNTANATATTVVMGGKRKNKWVALILCLLLGIVGGHKFYEGKIGMGILYLFTLGILGVGVIIDFIVILFKPNPYYV